MILYGDKLAKKINRQTKNKIKKLKIKPGLAAILIGNNIASQLYISIKKNEAKKIGINFYKYYFPQKTNEKKILKTIDLLNKDKKIHGIIIQLPLPKKFNTNKIVQSINQQKDVDGFHKKNIKKLLKNNFFILPPLISAILELIKASKEKLIRKKVVIIAKSKIFTDSLKVTLKKEKINPQKIKWVKSVNQKTLKTILKADIIIIALGQAKILTENFVKKGAIIIDVGINKINNKTVGDVDFDKVQNKAGYITPVPKGIGPMTVAMLLKNTLKLYLKK